MDCNHVISIILYVILLLNLSRIVNSEDSITEAAALSDVKDKLIDSNNIFLSWDVLQPSTICTWEHVTCAIESPNVVKLTLSSAGLSGILSPKLGSLSYLTHLLLSDNNISGSIPPEIGNLANLEYLYLDSNKLSGTVPLTLNNLKALTALNLSFNHLEGQIPSLLSRLFTSDSFLGNSFLHPSTPPPVAIASMASTGTVSMASAFVILTVSSLFLLF